MPLDLHLPSLVANLARSSRAWSATSSEGAARVSAVGSALVTLQSQRTGLLPRAARGQLGALLAQADADLRWLQGAVAKLRRIAAGAEDYVAQLRRAVGGPKLTWSLGAERWLAMVADVEGAMRADLADKQQVLAEVERATCGRGLHVERIELLAALWLEQPAILPHVMELPQAVLEAERDAERVANLSVVAEAKEDDDDASRKNLTPALSILLG